MILPTMNDKERAYEAFRVAKWLCGCFDSYRQTAIDKFRRGTRFPYFQRFVVTDDKRNEWVCLFYVLTKGMKKKGLYYTQAYTVYNVPPKRRKDDTNAGKGILLFDPFAIRNRIDNVGETRGAIIIDIVPHAFNRYTERYLKPIGRDGLEFGYKVENMLSRWQWFDISADQYGDINAMKHQKECLCPYDVIMRGGGMLRGQILGELFIRFTTYVSEEMMFENQLDRQDEMRQEYFRVRHKLWGEVMKKVR